MGVPPRAGGERAQADGRAITFTLDLEDHRPDGSAELRYPTVMRRVLDWLDERSIRGTVFVVGEVAEAQPDLVRDIADRGHEIALHCWRHVPLTELSPAVFRDETTRAKAMLEDLSSAPVAGYRAPTFSLVPSTAWAIEVLGDVGFTYSSSVLAGHNPLFGWPGAPSRPFRWPNGLVELPVPVAGVGRFRVPYLGGTYLRVLPRPVVAGAQRLSRSDVSVPWTYTHPYDFDPDEPKWAVPDAGRLSPLLWAGRKRLFGKLERLLGDGNRAGPPLGERLSAADAGPVFSPSAGEATGSGRG
ncbi:MAG: polysaccharide deacetylase family protein [Actinobacteria bacterium]|nr:polysaccharide deacetylase family protein [Actinomycetota bacterium]